MKLLAFSDLHCDLATAARLVEQSAEADAVVGAGDFASVHSGLEETIAAIGAIEPPVVLVPGNNETEGALRDACGGWDAATVLHGEGAEVGGVPFFGLGAGVPITPWDWSFDLDEQEAAVMLEGLRPDAVLVSHSPPFGHVDVSSTGHHLGSRAILQAVEAIQPPLTVCGHIHESWGQESRIGATRVVNLGPEGALLDI